MPVNTTVVPATPSGTTIEPTIPVSTTKPTSGFGIVMATVVVISTIHKEKVSTDTKYKVINYEN
jgi:hypothetical protein